MMSGLNDVGIVTPSTHKSTRIYRDVPKALRMEARAQGVWECFVNLPDANRTQRHQLADRPTPREELARQAAPRLLQSQRYRH